MLQNRSSLVKAFLMSVVLAGCGGDYAADADVGELDMESMPAEQLGVAHQAASACLGDDVNYDYNAFAASLAVAIANELHRWDVNADFEVRNGKLELSTTGEMRCGRGCQNTRAILRLQDDVTSVVPNHSPSLFRSKLTGWYQVQRQKLTVLVDSMLHVDKGVYRLQVQHSGKYMNVKAGSTSDNALVVQRSTAAQPGADQWRVVLDHGTHQLINVRSGKCLALAVDSPGVGVGFVQQKCSTSATQRFTLALTNGYYSLLTKYKIAVDVQDRSKGDDAPLGQYTWWSQKANQMWTFEPYGKGAHVGPENAATAMYQLAVKHSGKSVGVVGGSMTDGSAIEQRTYSASNDAFHWYVLQVGDKYQFVNRRSSKCLALLNDSPTALLTQRSCDAKASTQLFTLNPTEDGSYVIFTKYDNLIEVNGASMSDGALLDLGASQWDANRRITLTPILAGEPHNLTFSHTSDDADCGELNYWYTILKPNGQTLKSPQDSFVQLIFAGGKQTVDGSDVNPFIAQQVSGNRVAIDPTYGLNAVASTTTGTCSTACVKYSPTNVAGECCSCNGRLQKFARSSWSSVTFICQ